MPRALILDVWIPGLPRPAGSKSASPYVKDIGGRVPAGGLHTLGDVSAFIKANVKLGVRVFDDNEHSRAWKKHVAMLSRKPGLGIPEKGGEYFLSLVFYRPRPENHFRSNGKLKDWAPSRPLGKPDTLKLARAVEDALTGLVWFDDSEVTGQRAFKRYGEPGVRIRVYRIGEVAAVTPSVSRPRPVGGPYQNARPTAELFPR